VQSKTLNLTVVGLSCRYFIREGKLHEIALNVADRTSMRPDMRDLTRKLNAHRFTRTLAEKRELIDLIIRAKKRLSREPVED